MPLFRRDLDLTSFHILSISFIPVAPQFLSIATPEKPCRSALKFSLMVIFILYLFIALILRGWMSKANRANHWGLNFSEIPVKYDFFYPRWLIKITITDPFRLDDKIGQSRKGCRPLSALRESGIINFLKGLIIVP